MYYIELAAIIGVTIYSLYLFFKKWKSCDYNKEGFYKGLPWLLSSCAWANSINLMIWGVK